MRFDAINPASMIPAQPTEGGTPILGQIPFDPAMVVPMPNLPDDGSRPEDKHSKNEQEKAEAKKQADEELPEIFQLIMARQFTELFRFYFFVYDSETWMIKKKWRELLGVHAFDPLPFAMKKSPEVHEKRTHRYEYSIFYHNTKPGKRFTGAI